MDIKLSDDEIVKALECCANGGSQKDCDLCPIGVIKCFEQENLMPQLALDLINRLKEGRKTFFRIAKQRNEEKRELEKKVEELQTEIEELRKTKVIYETVDYCYEDLKEAQAEIERLSKKAVALEVETNNQKAEIERLKEYNLNLNGMNLEFIDKNAELQKQVDELKKRLHWIWVIGVDYDGCSKVESLKELIDEMVKLTQIESKDLDEYFTYNTTQGGKMNILSIVRKQAVKDTAKEILQMLYDDRNGYWDSCDCGKDETYWRDNSIQGTLNEIKERYGVEVE